MKNSFNNIFLIIIFIIVLSIGALQPRMADDYGYYDQFHEQHFFQILSNTYMNWSGRVLNLFIMKFSTYNDFFHYLSGALNGAAFLASIFIIIICALGRFPDIFSYDRMIFLMAFSAVWFGMPALGECVFWRSGSGSYLWPMLFGLIFITPFVLWYKSGKSVFPDKILYSILIIFAGIIAGLSHEQVVISIGFLMGVWVAYILWFKNIEKKVPYYLYFGFASFIIGGLISFLAPGNYKRMGAFSINENLFGKLAKQIGDFIIYVIGYGAESFWIWLVVIVLTSFILNGKITRDRMNDSILWLITAFVSILLVILFPFGGQRPMYFFIIFITLSFMSLLNINVKNLKAFNKEKINEIITVSLMSILAVDCTLGLFSNYFLAKQMSDRQKIIMEAKEKGLKKIIVPPIEIRESHITFTSDNPDSIFLDKSINVDYSLENSRYKPKNIVDELKVYLRSVLINKQGEQK